MFSKRSSLTSSDRAAWPERKPFCPIYVQQTWKCLPGMGGISSAQRCGRTTHSNAFRVKLWEAIFEEFFKKTCTTVNFSVFSNICISSDNLFFWVQASYASRQRLTSSAHLSPGWGFFLYTADTQTSDHTCLVICRCMKNIFIHTSTSDQSTDKLCFWI